ncbi:MAG: LysR family transcriptional regulator, partial [Gammaproteobacteria bacterium]|nr:LysR family transcriptional regulator [Gammaproteobacteria bacterium]
AGLGISILSVHTLSFGGNVGLATLDVQQLPIETRWYFVWLAAKRLSPVAQTFLEYVQQEGRRDLLEALAATGVNR